jgi:hypothetical protein
MAQKKVLLASLQAGLIVESQRPLFKYTFKKADEPVSVHADHAEKILQNNTFYRFKKQKVIDDE